MCTIVIVKSTISNSPSNWEFGEARVYADPRAAEVVHDRSSSQQKIVLSSSEKQHIVIEQKLQQNNMIIGI